MAWNCDNFLNPVEPLGIPNIEGTIVEYDGDAPVPPSKNKSSIKWLKSKAFKLNINLS